MNLEPICNRCGACCHFIVGDKVRRCKFLIKIGSKFSCRIYNSPERLGKEIYKGIFCNRIEDIGLNFNGCPYNKPEKNNAPNELQPPF